MTYSFNILIIKNHEDKNKNYHSKNLQTETTDANLFSNERYTN